MSKEEKEAKKQERIKELNERIEELNSFISEIEEKLRARVSEDVDSYELASDLGKKRTTRGKVSDYIKMKKEYQKEKLALEDRLRYITGSNPRHVLIRF